MIVDDANRFAGKNVRRVVASLVHIDAAAFPAELLVVVVHFVANTGWPSHGVRKVVAPSEIVALEGLKAAKGWRLLPLGMANVPLSHRVSSISALAKDLG